MISEGSRDTEDWLLKIQMYFTIHYNRKQIFYIVLICHHVCMDVLIAGQI